MSKTVIQVSNVSKQYRLGKIGSGSFNDDLTRWWAKLRGKEDPFLKIGEVNERDKKGQSDYIWALRDVSFEVVEGEVLGIIGKNGSGKSTLLKILSQVTLPTLGEVKIKGRVASLLEVGTGFHPDLSGRENVFLNGAILGMSKKEIRSKFDEIVDFSGVERYIDTPVKRYSSGMKVRLGFAVAAHLDPEILIVDEVLAVGDAEFQSKCLGKMKNVAGSGRTVLFVSHNIYAIRTLCTRAILLENGSIKMSGDTDEVANAYVFSNRNLNEDKLVHAWKEGHGRFEGGELLEAKLESPDPVLSKKTALNCSVTLIIENDPEMVGLTMHLLNEDDLVVFASTSLEDLGIRLAQGRSRLEVIIPSDLLNTGTYRIRLMMVRKNRAILRADDVLIFTINEIAEKDERLFQKKKGIVRPALKWSLTSAE
ncbi:MAG TPA: ABC transporter ATP-binding protein [Bacteroidia bacterium]|nr:ABC transporter ATP-binding protein [Bacteroidia bacterium]